MRNPLDHIPPEHLRKIDDITKHMKHLESLGIDFNRLRRDQELLDQLRPHMNQLNEAHASDRGG